MGRYSMIESSVVAGALALESLELILRRAAHNPNRLTLLYEQYRHPVVTTLSNFKKALDKLQQALHQLEARNENHLKEMLQVSVIKYFEMAYELAWLTIKDYYEEQGETNIPGSKNAFRLAYARELIENESAWLEAIESRKLTAHTYDEDTANDVAEKIATVYMQLFKSLANRLKEEAKH